MSKSLLSHIAGNFISEYENVANSSVAYLLNEYQAARAALAHVIEMDSVPYYYVTELATKSNGRPDVTGLNANGDKMVIIEGKFWANLTENQPVHYLEELSEGGKLLFLTPEKRICSLKTEIDRRLDGVNDRVEVCSWNKFLTLVEAENRKNYNDALASDLAQFRELCRRMDDEGMAPLSASDLDPMHGRMSYYFSEIIDACNHALRDWEHSNFNGLRTTATKNGYGFYFHGFGFGCFLQFSPYAWFTKGSHTPIWLDIYDSKWARSEKIFHYLNMFDSQNSYDEEGHSSYGIVLQTGMDKYETVHHIRKKVISILEHLHQNLESSR